jgi:hypothetical protein
MLALAAALRICSQQTAPWAEGVKGMVDLDLAGHKCTLMHKDNKLPASALFVTGDDSSLAS